MRKTILLALTPLLIASCSRDAGDYSVFVDPFIGTDGHGHTFPGATTPFGMVQLSPDTRKDSWDGCSGYHYSDNTILGFSHTHLSGTGVGDYGDIRFMPMAGKLHVIPGTSEDPSNGYRSSFSHQSEEALPGYYKVRLDDHGIDAELTATPRCGFHKYTFPAGEPAYILIDLTESITSDVITGLKAEFIGEKAVAGYRRTSGWAKDQHVYFYAEFSRPFDSFGVVENGEIRSEKREATGADVKAYAEFRTNGQETIYVKVGISGTSIEGAKRNLDQELDGWNFDKAVRNSRKMWNRELSRIEVKGSNEQDKKVFYTALYHTMIAPNLFSDSDGSYRGHDGSVHRSEDHDMYTVFSLWDTYRALHPLLTIIKPELNGDLIHTMLDIFDKGGLLPVWELAGNETFCMIGYHAIPVIVDAYLKGFTEPDGNKALNAMKNSAMKDHFGLESYRRRGYIPAEDEGEAVSKTLEYAYDDWCIAMMAKALGEKDDYIEYLQRSQYYKNLFDPETRFFRGKRNGMFVEPFDPTEVNFMLTEANTWQYTFYVPHDINGLIDLMGGDEAFIDKLDELFGSGTGLSGRDQADITGLIGQYAHGNEPSHHMAYLYDYAGAPYKTQAIVRRICSELYGPEPDGLCGNEDCGQMSAWYVMSAMGFYPVTPGSGIYAIGSPVFDEIRINLENGRSFVIKANNNSENRIYIGSARLNGMEYKKTFISHEDIMSGGSLEFDMDPRPNTNYGSDEADRPVSSVDEHLIVPVPFFSAASFTFQDHVDVTAGHTDDKASVYYAFGMHEKEFSGNRWTDPIRITESTYLSAYARAEDGRVSKPAYSRFYKLHHDWTIQLKNNYSPQYAAGGDIALIDGQTGNANFRTGSWQGYYGVDLEATIDLGERRKIQKVSVNFLEDQNSWIFMPLEVEFSVSNKPYDFKTISILKYDGPERTDKPVIRTFSREPFPASARYLKVKAKNRGVCPDWHKGAGSTAWIFVDEITIE